MKGAGRIGGGGLQEEEALSLGRGVQNARFRVDMGPSKHRTTASSVLSLLTQTKYLSTHVQDLL